MTSIRWLAFAVLMALTVGTLLGCSRQQTGTLEVRVMDAPPEGVSSIVLTVRNVQVHQSQGDMASGWVTVIEEEQTFDLLEIVGVEAVLGSVQMAPGRYGQVRLEVTSAKVTVNGEEQIARVPSGTVRVVGGFDVEAGNTTLLTLDFDAGRTVTLRGGNQPPNINPSVKLLVRRGNQSLAQAIAVGETNVPAP